MAPDNTVVFDREVRGIPLWLLREYLEEAGGQADGKYRVDGNGWAAELTQIEDFQLGSIRVGQVHLRIEGERQPMERLEAIMEQKLLRAGG